MKATRRISWVTALLLSASSLGAVTPAYAGDADTYRQLDQLMDVFERVRAEYVDKVEDKKLLEGAIDGMLAALDPHSGFLNARDFESMRTQTDGEYGGLGLEVTLEEGAVKVISPIDDSPAARAGVKSGDYITQINREPVFGLNLSEAVAKMKGPPKSSIVLTIVREGQEKSFDVTLTREVITLKPVRFEAKGTIGYIRISQFSKLTGPGVRTALTTLEKQIGPGRITGYVIDLRRNPGGLLDQAIEVSDAFLDRGEIVSQRGRRKDEIQRYYARSGDLSGGRPLVVLVDEATASAAEIVAGALQDQRRALVIGERTFGKGLVQTIIPMGQDTALRLTTARYYTPSGRSVQEQGIEPNIQVPQLSDSDLSKRPVLRESDLRNHLQNEKKDGARSEEADTSVDPRFKVTSDALKKQGITDYQLDYALKLLRRLNQNGVRVATSRG